MEQKKLIWIYPGQGSQFVGMGKDLADNHPMARALFKKANDLMGFDLEKIIFEGPADTLKRTLYTQPAILVMCMILHKLLVDTKTVPPPIAVTGHSLGEYTALWAAGVLDDDTVMRLVKRRAELMEEASQNSDGKMAAIIGLKEDKLEEIVKSCSGTVILANFNAPKQIVISGETAAVQEATEKCTAAGAKRAIVLKVSGAFHSPLMQKAADELGKLIDEATFNPPAMPVITNSDATPCTDPEKLREKLRIQMISSVLWTKIVTGSVEQFKPDAFVEIGPSTVLAGLIQRINPAIPCSNIGTWNDILALKR